MPTTFDDLDPGIVLALSQAGRDLESLAGLTEEELQQIPDIGPARAKEIFDALVANPLSPTAPADPAAPPVEEVQPSAATIVPPETIAGAEAAPNAGVVETPPPPDELLGGEALFASQETPETQLVLPEESLTVAKPGKRRESQGLGRAIPVSDEQLYFSDLVSLTPMAVARQILQTITKKNAAIARAKEHGTLKDLTKKPNYRRFMSAIGIGLYRLSRFYETEKEFEQVCKNWGFDRIERFDEVLLFGSGIWNLPETE